MKHAGAGVLNGLFILAAFFSCGNPQQRPVWEGWQTVPVRYAEYFQLWERGGDRLLLTFGPGGTSDTTGIFVLSATQADAPMPARTVRLAGPLQRIALMSTTHAPFITGLNRADAVVGCAHLGRLRDTVLLGKARSGRLQEIGTADGMDRERILMLAPEALFTYPYGSSGNTEKVASVPTISISEYLEQHPLGRAEWIRAFGMLFGRQALADSLFATIVERYGEASSTVPSGEERPMVFFGSSWKGTWSIPSGNSCMARLIGDAGGRYLFADRKSTGNFDIDLETVLQEGAKANYWGRILEKNGPVMAADVAGDDSRVLALPAFKERRCFYANSTESDFFGQAVLEPDVVLKDLIGIFNPGLEKGYRPVYFKPVQ